MKEILSQDYPSLTIIGMILDSYLPFEDTMSPQKKAIRTSERLDFVTNLGLATLATNELLAFCKANDIALPE